jgi:hypothetical protein
MGRSGAGLALDTFFPGAREHASQYIEWLRLSELPGNALLGFFSTLADRKKLPAESVENAALALYVEDRDIWAWKLHKSREVSAGLTLLPHTLEAWNEPRYLASITRNGAAVLASERQTVKRLVKHARTVTWPEGDVLVVNSPVLQSEIGEALVAVAPRPLQTALIWYEDEDGRRVNSLRSAPSGADVSEMARKRGGGGHFHAAGFTSI